MADFDAGTARAHIKVDGDARGADKATHAVEGFSKALEFIASHLGRFVAAMDKIEGELRNVEGDFKDAADAANKYDKAVDGLAATHIKTSKSTRDLSKNLEDLHGRLKFAHDAWADYGIPIVQATRAMNEFAKTRGGVVGVFQAVSRAGIAGAAMAALKSHFIGMGLALRQAPVWQQQLARMAQNIGLVTLAGSRFRSVIGPLTAGFAKLVGNAEGADFAIAGFSHTLDRTVGSVSRFFGTLDQVPAGLFKMVGGLAVAQSGLRGLQTRFSALNTIIGSGGGRIGQALRFVLLPGVVASSAAVQGFDASLRFLSNTIAGLWSGVKQLSGGFLAIPGAIAMVGAAAGPLVIIAKTLKSNFKDLIAAVQANDVEKFAEAMQKIPPYLRPLAQAVANAIGPLKSLGDVLTATFVSGGLDQQFASLVNTWLPAISTGADQVANSWKILTNHVAAFLGEAKTVSGVNTIFMHTSETMNAVGATIKPVLDGFRDIAVVGSGFIRDLAERYLPQIASKFGNWATNAVATGKAMKWMDDSVRAVKNLYNGFDQLIRGVWSLLTLFQTKPGDTFLDRFAASMKKFNDEVTRSKASGELKKISDAVKGMGTDKLKELKQIFIDSLPAIRAFVQFLGQIGGAFSTIMLPVIESTIAVLGELIKGLNALGIGPAIGYIIALVKTFGLLRGVIGTAWDAFKVFLGFAYFKTGAEAVVLGLAGTLEKFGPIGQRASSALLGVGDAMAGLVRSATVVGIGAFAVWEVLQTGADEMKASAQSITDASKHSAQGISDLRKAFYADTGTTGPTVIAQLAKNAKQDIDDLQNISDKAPGVAAKIKDFLFQGFGNASIAGAAVSLFRGPSDELTNLEAKAKDAKSTLSATNDALKAMGATSGDLSKYLYGSNDAFAAFVGQLSKAGQSGAVEYWSKLRTQFTELQNEMEAAGPGAVMLAAGIDKIAQSGGNATTKLDGLKMALQGLGLLKEDQYEAALNFAKAIDGLGDAAANAADKSQPLKDILDPNTGILNTAAGVNAQNLYNAIQPIATAFLNAAASGQDLSAFIPKMNDNLEKLRNSFGLSKDAFDKFIQGLGIDPPIVSLLVQAKDDGVEKGLIEIAAKARTAVGNSAPIELPVGIDAPGVAKQVNDLFNNPNAVGVHGQNIVLSPGIDQAAIDKISAYLAQKYGIHLPGGPPVDPSVSATVPITPTAPGAPPVVPAPGTPPAPKGSGAAPAAPAGPPAPHLPPGMPMPALPPGSQPKDTHGRPIPGSAPVLPPGTYLPSSMTPPAGTPSAPTTIAPVDTAPPLTPAPPPVAPPPGQPTPASGQAVNIPVQINGLDQFGKLQDAFKALADTLAKNQGEWLAWNAGIDGALAQVLSSFDKVMSAIGQKGTEGGKAFTNDFAAGLNDPAAIQKVVDAVARVMQTVADHAPHSPAKRGPLSGSGWSGHSGAAFSGDFATGILGGAAGVGDAASKVAGKAAGALKPATPYGKFGFTPGPEPFKDLKDLLKFASDGLNVFKSVSENIFGMAKFAMDPFGTAAKAGAAGGPGGKAGGIGNILNQGASALVGNVNPSKDDIASAIAGEAAKRGYDRNTAIGVISAAMHESGLDPTVTNASGHESLFQTSADKGVGHNAGAQIQWMFNQLDSLGGPGASKGDPLDFIAQNIEKGGYGGAALATHSVAAANLYDKVLQSGATAGQGAFALPGIGALASNPASMASRLPKAGNIEEAIQAAGGIPPLYQPGSTNLPQWMQQLAQSFGLTASTYPSGGSLHQMGFAADFNDPNVAKGAGSANLDRLAQYLSGNLSGQTLQLIHQGLGGEKYGIAGGQAVGPGTSQPGYYAGDFGGHQDHVHWATDVAPILAGANAGAMPFAAGNMPGQQAGYGTQNPIVPPGGMPGQQPGQMPAPAAGLGQDLGQTPGATGPLQPQQTAQLFGSQDQTGGQVQQVSNQTQQLMGQVENAASGAGNIASSVMQTMQAGLDAWGATKYIADQMVRGISDTEDIYNLIDQAQKYITFAADIANTAGQIASAAGSASGGMDMGGGAAAGQALQLISSMLTAINSAIDLGQEAYRIFGSYFGQFLGFLTGGAGGMMGDVHFLLDQNTGKLMAYSGDNPLMKVSHNIPGAVSNPDANNQLIGQLNYYAGPGEDPRVGTRNMMYQVRASQLNTVTAQ